MKTVLNLTAVASVMLFLAGLGLGILLIASAQSALHEIEAGISFLIAAIAVVGLAVSIAALEVIGKLELKAAAAPPPPAVQAPPVG